MSKAMIALVTASSARAHDKDMPELHESIHRLGAGVDVVEWDDPSVAWHHYDLVVLRSTWDYPRRLADFLAWADRVHRLGTLVNDADVVRWNTDKGYMLDPSLDGCPVVPTWRIEPGDDSHAAFAALRDRYPAADIVVKPSIGSGGAYACRHGADTPSSVPIGHADSILAAGYPVLVQPYFGSVDTDGETTLVYFDGAYSHAIRKGRMLHAGQAPSARPTPPTILACVATDDERAVANMILERLPFPGPLLYARIDLVRDQCGQPHVLELELTEPTLFLRHDPESANRFATRILARATRSRT